MGEKVVFVTGALAGALVFSCIFARLLAFVSLGLAGAKNCFRSRKLGELRDKRGFDCATGLGTLFDERFSDEAKGSAGREG